MTATKVALVTGGGRGIGRAIALRLAADGFDVVVAARSLRNAERYGEELAAATVPEEIEAMGRRSLGVDGDLTSHDAARDLVRRAMDEFGRIDVVVNNAGGAIGGSDHLLASEIPDEALEFHLNLNMRSAIWVSQEAVPIMRDAHNGGSIVNITARASLDLRMQGGRQPAYAIAKSGLVTFSRYLAYEVGESGIRVNCVSPGLTFSARVALTAAQRGLDTPERLAETPLRRYGTPEDIAGAVSYFASPDSSYVTGQVLAVDGGTVLTPS
jgi:NAD(P)-dependent dehydrogenase (short-subunit alcohol dehydrogenase family)